MPKNSPVTTDAWGRLRSATRARVALGRVGGSLPTREWLDFQAAHAAARDAVHQEFDALELAREISSLGIETVTVDSAATNRADYLQRPDLGRRLDLRATRLLERRPPAGDPIDLVILVSDGLSALAAHRQAPSLLAELWPRLTSAGWRLGPLVIARFGRVALQDEVGQRLAAALALMLIGERPGLGSPDSLGAYLVFNPRIGNTDANRNCVSNIRPDGTSAPVAAETLFHLLQEARRLRLSGVALKDHRALALAPGLEFRD
jgi:ethanolamine ammonia-lyase small subunit